MKKTKILMYVISCIALILALCSCSAQKRLVGKWEVVEGDFFSDSIEFFSDGTYITEIGNFNGDYSVDGNRIKFGGILYSKVGTFKVSGNKLVIKNDAGGVATYRRVGTNGGADILGVVSTNIFGIIFKNWWTFEHFAQAVIVLILFIISRAEIQKIRKEMDKKKVMTNGECIGKFTKKFYYAHVLNLMACLVVNFIVFIAAYNRNVFYWLGFDGLTFWIFWGMAFGLISSTYYFGELNKSIQYAYLIIEDGKLVARNPEMCGFSVKLSEITSVEILKYRPKKMPLAYRFLTSDKLAIYANNTVYEAYGIENIYEVKSRIDKGISETK